MGTNSILLPYISITFNHTPPSRTHHKIVPHTQPYITPTHENVVILISSHISTTQLYWTRTLPLYISIYSWYLPPTSYWQHNIQHKINDKTYDLLPPTLILSVSSSQHLVFNRYTIYGASWHTSRIPIWSLSQINDIYTYHYPLLYIFI